MSITRNDVCNSIWRPPPENLRRNKLGEHVNSDSNSLGAVIFDQLRSIDKTSLNQLFSQSVSKIVVSAGNIQNMISTIDSSESSPKNRSVNMADLSAESDSHDVHISYSEMRPGVEVSDSDVSYLESRHISESTIHQTVSNVNRWAWNGIGGLIQFAAQASSHLNQVASTDSTINATIPTEKVRSS
jgi:hypothetical protein